VRTGVARTDEIIPRHRRELGVGHMVGRLHRRQAREQVRIEAVDVLDELRFGVRRPDDHERLCRRQVVGDALEEDVIGRHAIAFAIARLGPQMTFGVLGSLDDLSRGLRIDRDDSRLAAVDPDHRMFSSRHVPAPSSDHPAT